jgi:hypothetical protein
MSPSVDLDRSGRPASQIVSSPIYSSTSPSTASINLHRLEVETPWVWYSPVIGKIQPMWYFLVINLQVLQDLRF